MPRSASVARWRSRAAGSPTLISTAFDSGGRSYGRVALGADQGQGAVVAVVAQAIAVRAPASPAPTMTIFGVAIPRSPIARDLQPETRPPSTLTG